MYFKLDVRIRNYSKPNYPFLLFPLYFPLLFYFSQHFPLDKRTDQTQSK